MRRGAWTKHSLLPVSLPVLFPLLPVQRYTVAALEGGGGAHVCPATARQSLSLKGCCVYHVKGRKEELQDCHPEGAQRGEGWWHGVKIRIPNNSAWPTELPPKMEKWGGGGGVITASSLGVSTVHLKYARKIPAVLPHSFDEDVEYEV